MLCDVMLNVIMLSVVAPLQDLERKEKKRKEKKRKEKKRKEKKRKEKKRKEKKRKEEKSSCTAAAATMNDLEVNIKKNLFFISSLMLRANKLACSLGKVRNLHHGRVELKANWCC